MAKTGVVAGLERLDELQATIDEARTLLPEAHAAVKDLRHVMKEAHALRHELQRDIDSKLGALAAERLDAMEESVTSYQRTVVAELEEMLDMMMKPLKTILENK